MSFVKEFREFALKGNVIDMAVGLIIGAAFGKIVTSLVNDVLMPPIGMLVGRMDFSSLKLQLNDATFIKYGAFLNSLVDFVIVALVIFVVIKQMNRLKRQAPPAAPNTKDCPFCATAIPLAANRCPHCTSQLAS